MMVLDGLRWLSVTLQQDDGGRALEDQEEKSLGYETDKP